jgi:hypothetical protein
MFGGVGPIADAIDDPRHKLMKKEARDHRLNDNIEFSSKPASDLSERPPQAALRSRSEPLP